MMAGIQQQQTAYDSQFNSVSYGNPDVPKEEQDLVKSIMQEFFRYKRHRSLYDKRWLDYYYLFRGKQWSAKRPSWLSGEIVNMIWQTIQSQAPLQTDARPKFSFLPMDPTDRDFAQILDKVSDADWERYNWLQVVLATILDGYLYGTGFSHMLYDHDYNYGMGAPLYENCDPFYCYPDPSCNNINDSKSEGFFYAYPEHTNRLRRKYPAKAHLIKPDIVDSLLKKRTDLGSAKFNDWRSSTAQLAAINYDDWDNNCQDRTLVIYAYLKPQDVDQQEQKTVDDAGNEINKYIVKKKYPRGRHLVIANGAILHDGPLPYADGLIPYSKYNNYVLPREFYGVSEVEQLENPQMVFNKILCFALDCLALTGNPIWVVDFNSRVDTDNLTNAPGGVVSKTPGSEVRREQGMPLNPGFLQILDRMVGWFNTVSGQSEFSEGNAPGGVTAASAIEQLINASRVRIRQKQRNLDAYLKDVGQQYINRIFEFYSAPRVFRVTNDQGASQYFKMEVENQEDGGKVARVQEYVETENGDVIEGNVRKFIVSGEFDIRVKTGSDMPFEIADIERKSLALFDRGIIDEEEVLTKLEYPNKDKVLERLAARKEAMAQQEAQSQQGAQ
jgi:hypothetical protein